MSGRLDRFRLPASLVTLALVTGVGASTAHGQAVRDSSTLSPSRPLTKQEIADACNHRPGARLRLYGCSAEASGIVRPAPLYIVDGVMRERDTAVVKTEPQLLEWVGVDPSDVLDITVVVPDAAFVRYGEKGRGGAIIIRTKSDSTSRRPPTRR